MCSWGGLLTLRMRNMWSLIFYLGRAQPPLSIVLLFLSRSIGPQDQTQTVCPGVPSISCLKAGTWDPLLQCYNACTWTNISLSYKIQRIYKRQKNNCGYAQLGQILDKRYKKDQKNPTATSEELGAKAGYCERPLHSTPPKGWATHLSHPLA